MADHGHNHEHDLVRAVHAVADAILELAKATEGKLPEADRRLLDATLAVSEAVTVKTERFSAALKKIDDRVPNQTKG